MLIIFIQTITLFLNLNLFIESIVQLILFILILIVNIKLIKKLTTNILKIFIWLFLLLQTIYPHKIKLKAAIIIATLLYLIHYKNVFFYLYFPNLFHQIFPSLYFFHYRHLLFRTLSIVKNIIFQSPKNVMLSTYSTSYSNLLVHVMSLCPLTWAKPDNPCLTSCLLNCVSL